MPPLLPPRHDAELPSIAFTRLGFEAREAGFQAARITVTRTHATAPLTVRYTASGTAQPGRDYATLSGRLDFAAGQTEVAIVIEPYNNYRNTRRNEGILLNLTPDPAYTLGSITYTVVTIVHDHTPRHLPPDAHFFAALDLALPALAAVRTAVAAGDYAAARTALAAHFRAPRTPVLPHTLPKPDFTLIEAALKHTYTVFGITHTFSKPIDWSATELTDPNYCWGFNRMEWWQHYTAAFTADPVKNERCARALVAELADWLPSSPVTLAYYPLQPGDRWRHLEVAIRAGFNWPIAFAHLHQSPLLSDDVLVDWIKSFQVHAAHLEVNAELFTNRGSAEAIALYVVGVLFPEFLHSADYIRLGLERMEGMLRHDVMPDGVENEFSPNYHSHVAEGIVKMRRVAVANGRTLTPFLETACVQLFDYLALASEPTFTLPHLNDSCHTNVPHCLHLAADVFPDRADYRWFATRGAEGKPPARTSALFPDAGHAIMRSHWGPDANYALLDAGPFGTSHGHEDCLSLNLSAYGRRALIDCGPYNYEDNHPYRLYSTHSHGKTMPLIDDLDQNRKSALVGRNNTDIRVGELVAPAPHTWDHATPVVWRTSPRYDYAAGSYGAHPDEVWGPQKLRPAHATRHVFLLKPDVWVVNDAVRTHDAQPHAYSGLFQFAPHDAQV
ncbi:MAG: heparinase II/III family protein, partial [Opitutaceae bacterium]|nr:heparinase II/III family protein [Opitutaceae bacterium]